MPDDSLIFPVTFELVVSVAATVLTCSLALLYLQRVRLERPAIGTFNRRDIAIVFLVIIGLPLLYNLIPLMALLVVLSITFTSALHLGLRSLMPPALTWLSVGLLIGGNIWLSQTMLGTVLGWQLFWIENTAIVITTAVAVSNLYIQGGMRMQHVAWFCLILSAYDIIFTFGLHITDQLVQRFLGWPFDPSAGFRLGLYNASIGLGDLLASSLFVLSAFKAYGRRPAQLALTITVVLGAATPALAPLLTRAFIDARTDLIVPAQALFGPGAFLTYRLMKRRYGPERTMQEFLTNHTSKRLPDDTPAPHPHNRARPELAPLHPAVTSQPNEQMPRLEEAQVEGSLGTPHPQDINERAV